MRGFESYNPIVQTVYFLCVTLCVMFNMNPVILTLSLAGALLLFWSRAKDERPASHVATAAMFVVMALLNPLFYHNGVTVLFVLNNNPVTLEALLFGLCASASIVSVLYWFRSFSRIMTGDRLMYVLGKLSPRLSLLLSTTLRYVPLFAAQTGRIKRAQTAIGQYKDNNIVDTVKSDVRVFSVMTTWALENGIVTADSMEARGYGCAPRTSFALWRMRGCDVVFLAATLVLSAVVTWAAAAGALTTEFYPRMSAPSAGALSLAAYTAYGIMALLPFATEITERIRWKYLLSKI